jgi:3'-5' exoribonuclease
MATVSELKEGQVFDGTLWLVSSAVKRTKSGDPYWEGQLQDATGSVSAKVWDSAGGKNGRVKALEPALLAGRAVRVRARVDTFAGALQLNILEAAAAPDASPEMFSPKSQRPLPDMLKELDGVIASLRDPDYKRLLAAFRSDKELFGPFCDAPAAKAIHHAWVHGLLEHSLQLAKGAMALAPLYPGLDGELVILGCFFHDAGKAWEISPLPGFEYTTQGKLLGHIYMGARLVERLCDQLKGFPAEKRLHLVHLVLSHQGDRSEGFGSAADPATPEALFFHHLDNLDAKVQNCMTSLSQAPESDEEFTPLRYPMRKAYYRGRPQGATQQKESRKKPEDGRRDDEKAQQKLW